MVAARRHYAVFAHGTHLADVALPLTAGPRDAADLAFDRYGPGAVAIFVGTGDTPPTEAQILDLLGKPGDRRIPRVSAPVDSDRSSFEAWRC